MIVVVAPPGDFDPGALAAFACNCSGVSFAPGTWHAPLIAPAGGSFLIVDRDDPAGNCDVIELAQAQQAYW
jgi:ureidoglycolate hydrolase